MSDRTLRGMYAGMVRGRKALAGSRGASAGAAWADVACFPAAVAGLHRRDVVLGCRRDGVLEAARPGGTLPWVADGLGRLYAAGGAAMMFDEGSERVAMAFFERHEADGRGWAAGMQAVAALPLVLVVLPRRQGKELEDLGAAARKAGVPGIAVDAVDAIALYRVAQESLVRARMGGGAALIEGVWFPDAGGERGIARDALDTLAEALVARKVASRGWVNRVGSAGSATAGKHDVRHR